MKRAAAADISTPSLYASEAEDDVGVLVVVVVVVVVVGEVFATISIATREPVAVLVERAMFRHVTDTELANVVSVLVEIATTAYVVASV